MLHHLSRLQHLTLGDLPDLSDDSSHLPRPSFRLQTLALSNPAPPALLDLLLGASQDSLVTLRFGGVRPNDVYDFSSFHYLQNVDLICDLPFMDPTDLADLFQTLGSMPSLRTLKIPDIYDEDGYHAGAQGPEAIDFLRLLPPSIVHIHLYTGLILSTRYLLDFVRNRTRLPVLQKLDVMVEMACDNDDSVPRSPAEIAAVLAAAEARGVLLRRR